MRVTFILAFAAMAAVPALVATPVLAQPTAHISGGNAALRSGPGVDYRTIGALPNGTEVVLDYCTSDDQWCHVAGYGWVDASWVVGWSAKIAVTPPSFLSNPTVEIDSY